jgi:hypothetical protein
MQTQFADTDLSDLLLGHRNLASDKRAVPQSMGDPLMCGAGIFNKTGIQTFLIQLTALPGRAGSYFLILVRR